MTPQRQTEQWMAFHAFILLFFTLLLLKLTLLPYLVFPAAFSFLFLYLQRGFRQKDWNFILQPANAVTGLRLLLLLSLFFVYSQIPSLLTGILALLIIILDGFDGYLARRYKTNSVFGEYLDMETDAFFVLTLCVLLYQLDHFGSWILGIGLLRYTYFLVLMNVKVPGQKEERVFLARLIAVVLMVTLAACFILPPVVYRPAVVIASLLTLFSFGKSFWSAVSQ